MDCIRVSGLESFVLRCPREVAPFLTDILKVILHSVHSTVYIF